MRKFFHRFKNFISNASEFIVARPVVLVICLSFWIMSLSLCSAYFAKYALKNKFLIDTLTMVSKEQKDQLLKENALQLNTIEKNRIEMYYQFIEYRKVHHFSVMRFFMIEYYAVIMVLCIITPITGTLLFFILQQGFNSASKKNKILFVVHAAASITFSTFVPVFKMEDNISINKDLYLKYNNLQNDLITYLATGKTQLEKCDPLHRSEIDLKFLPCKTKTDSLCYEGVIKYYSNDCKIPFAGYATKLDLKLKEYENIFIGFDFSKVPNYNSINKDLTEAGQ